MTLSNTIVSKWSAHQSWDFRLQTCSIDKWPNPLCGVRFECLPSHDHQWGPYRDTEDTSSWNLRPRWDFRNTHTLTTVSRCRIFIWASLLQQEMWIIMWIIIHSHFYRGWYNLHKENQSEMSTWKLQTSEDFLKLKYTTSLHFLLCMNILSNNRGILHL